MREGIVLAAAIAPGIGLAAAIVWAILWEGHRLDKLIRKNTRCGL